MPELRNNRWEKWCRAKAAGMTHADSYLAAGYQATTREIAKNGSIRLWKKQELKDRLTELKDQLSTDSLARAEINRNFVLEKLKLNYQQASQTTPVVDRSGNPTGEYTYQGSVANRSLELMGKELGMFVDRFVVGDLDGELDGMSPEQLRSFVRSLAMQVGLRVVEMTDDSTRDWIRSNARRVGLRVVETSGEDSGGAAASEDGSLSAVSEAGDVSPTRTH